NILPSNDLIEQMITDNTVHNEHSEHDETFESYSDSDAPVFSFQGIPLAIELDSSDSESFEHTEALGPDEDLDNTTTFSLPEQIVEVNLCSGKVLPPRLTSQDKGKQIMDSEQTPP
ncbi:hypothetical protein, partial [Klebsiella pneumoniae]|uniref:hypothetical protein n=1 Tax=Klebsiella pneumoniae TaxID=573 RepID=UPI001D0EB7E2